MKKLCGVYVVMAILAFSCKVQAYSWQEVANELRPTFTALDSVSVAYAKNLEDGTNAGSLVDHFFTTKNEVLSLNISLTNTNVSEGAKDVGALGVGPGISFFPMIRFILPEFAEKFATYIPDAVRPLTNRLYIGYAPSWNLNAGVRERFMHFIVSGLSF